MSFKFNGFLWTPQEDPDWQLENGLWQPINKGPYTKEDANIFQLLEEMKFTKLQTYKSACSVINGFEDQPRKESWKDLPQDLIDRCQRPFDLE